MAADDGRSKQVAGPVPLLFRSIGIRPKDLWIGEWVALLLGGAGGAWLAVHYAGRVKDVSAISGTVVSIVIGGVIAAVSVMIAGFDETYLRHLNSRLSDETKKLEQTVRNGTVDGREKERREGRLRQLRAEHQLVPFLTTIIIGAIAAVLLIVWSSLTETSDPIVRGVVGACAGATSLWTVANLPLALGMLSQFVRLRQALYGLTS